MIVNFDGLGYFFAPKHVLLIGIVLGAFGCKNDLLALSGALIILIKSRSVYFHKETKDVEGEVFDDKALIIFSSSPGIKMFLWRKKKKYPA